MINEITIYNRSGQSKKVNSQDFRQSDLVFEFIIKKEWSFDNTIHIIEDICSYSPFFEEGKIGILYPSYHKDFPHPGNLVIYNADKSVFKPITVPQMINEQTQRERITPKKELGEFALIKEYEIVDGKKHMLVYIATETYHTRWQRCSILEIQALDIETGLFHPTWSEGGIYW